MNLTRMRQLFGRNLAELDALAVKGLVNLQHGVRDRVVVKAMPWKQEEVFRKRANANMLRYKDIEPLLGLMYTHNHLIN